MDKDKGRRKELLEAYKQIKVYMGVYQVKNTVSGRLFIGAAPNLKSRWMTMRMQLDESRHANALLQEDWKRYGPGAFQYEVLEQAEVTDATDAKHELRAMEAKWKKALRPYGERGYHAEE